MMFSVENNANGGLSVMHNQRLVCSTPPMTAVEAVVMLHKIRKMNRHRFVRWVQRQPNFKGVVV